LGLVRKGETIVVTDRGKTVAHLIPPTPEEESPEGVEKLLKRLEAEGHLRLARDPFKRRTFKPIVTRGKPASQMIIEDRE
jgi:antitoxin (DNA-binding transcriptional repressor) of toxin-antitoxin stability system